MKGSILDLNMHLNPAPTNIEEVSMLDTLFFISNQFTSNKPSEVKLLSKFYWTTYSKKQQ